MKNQFPRMLTVVVLMVALVCLSCIITSCGSSDKDKAMAAADKFEALIEKYSDKFKEKKDAKDMAGLQQVMQEFQQETQSIVKELEGIKGNLSGKDKEEVEKRFEEVGRKMMKMMQP